MGSPEACRASVGIDDWVRLVQSYFNLDNQRYNISFQHNLEHGSAATTLYHMAHLYDADLLIDDTMHGAQCLANMQHSFQFLTAYHTVLHTRSNNDYLGQHWAGHNTATAGTGWPY